MIKMVSLYMRVIGYIMIMKVMENIILKMEIIMKANLKMGKELEREYYMIKMVKFNIKENGLII